MIASGCADFSMEGKKTPQGPMLLSCREGALQHYGWCNLVEMTFAQLTHPPSPDTLNLTLLLY